uniref:C-1-tetrahydrofolate synthase, cytoplasmic n=1 Tax=Aceria tosichella TaxID=561515 RepID=A0A6G1SF63_9ACAR
MICVNRFAILFRRITTNHLLVPTTTAAAKTAIIAQQKLASDYRAITTTTKAIKMAKIISGKEVADEIRAKLKAKVETLPVKPKLVIVQVGGREDSNVYIRMKMQFADSIGATSELVKLERDVSEKALAQKIVELNQDSSVHGIITQLPFDCSNKINSDYIVNLIDPKKDVDGLSVYNAGKLSHGELDSSAFVPCTPNGCLELIKKSGIKIEGSRSVVIGRSKIVGSPMAQLLMWNNSTVTICHSRTKNIDEICRQADILVAAVGRAQMVKGSWLKPGAVVIDCGINVIPDATKKSGTRLVGDVDFEDCRTVASAITPVPGGVGPMTVAMLISNTVESASRTVSAN